MILQLLLKIISLLWLVVPLAVAAPPRMVPLNCPEACGNVTITYLFGIGQGCYHDEWYEISCNNSFIPNKPFLAKFNELEVLNISFVMIAKFNELEVRELTVNGPIGSNCPEQGGSNVWTSTNFSGSPFTFSNSKNEFTVVGCDNNALLRIGEANSYQINGEVVAGCTSRCKNTSTRVCYGINCCQSSLVTTHLKTYNIEFDGSTSNCSHAFLVQNGWFPGNVSTLDAIREMKHAPVMIDWKVTHLGNLIEGVFSDYSCGPKSESEELDYYCSCRWSYEGNPFIPHGCKIVEACANCKGECTSDYLPGLPGNFYCKNSNKLEIILGKFLGGVLGLLLLCGFSFWFYKYSKRRRLMKFKRKFFENQLRLLQQQISSDGGTVQKTIVFSSKELEKATDNFNQNRILGQGGQGTVYKGMLSDGKIIAIKKSKVVEESQLEQFINEVVILSQINHRNIVKLLGCCLETDVPLLVYEFVSNGNLFQLIHDQNDEFPLSWKMRLQIATEVAGALAYLHSSSSTPIYHRDIKSTNILLDEKFRVKVADFGTSRSIPIDQTHLTTLVHGTFGYLDPEYFQSSQFTDKSDVYSFGVVLVELLTGLKAISSATLEEEKNLAARFILYLKEMRLFDLVDARIIGEAQKEEIIAVADIVKRCLHLNGKRRPTMKEVMMELEGIKMSHMPPIVPTKFNKDEMIIEMSGTISAALTSRQSSVVYHRSLSSQTSPLLINTV